MPNMAPISEELSVAAHHKFQDKSNLRFLTLKTWHDAPNDLKFDMKEHTTGLIFHVKFHSSVVLGGSAKSANVENFGNMPKNA